VAFQALENASADVRRANATGSIPYRIAVN
jgi:hypothetical protein